MQALKTYRQRRAEGWTRIDMLLDIYDAALASLHQGVDILQQSGGTGLSPTITLRAQQRLLLLLEGIDPQSGEVAQSIERLLVACLELVARSDLAAWNSAIRILEPLREGFGAVADEARQLEHSGKIPPLDWQRSPVAARM